MKTATEPLKCVPVDYPHAPAHLPTTMLDGLSVCVLLFKSGMVEQVMRIEELVTEAAYSRVRARDNGDHSVWRNPRHDLVKLIEQAPHGREGMRAILTRHDLYFWQSTGVLHDDFVRQTGIEGIRVALRRDGVVDANEETVVVPSLFSWVFGPRNGDDLHMDQRRQAVEQWLKRNARLMTIYPRGFSVGWYM